MEICFISMKFVNKETHKLNWKYKFVDNLNDSFSIILV